MAATVSIARGFGIGLVERIYQGEVVVDEVIPEVRPVSRVGIVYAQMNHDDVALETQGVLIFFLLDVRAMAMIQQRRAGFAEVADFIVRPQQSL